MPRCTFAIVAITIGFNFAQCVIVRRNIDGSISSNSGSVSITHRFLNYFNRTKRASYYIDPAPRLIYSMPVPTDWANYIISEHNRYRRLIPATNMQEMSWDNDLAAQAQKHADRCLFAHSEDRVNTGENIWAAPFSNYEGAVKLWFDEVYDSQCGCQNLFKECCGHYTQLVWADSNRVGCGASSCRSILNAPGHYYIFVCHYTPVGNLIYVDDNQWYPAPAFQYRKQNELPCSDCPKDSTCNYGLCNNVRK